MTARKARAADPADMDVTTAPDDDVTATETTETTEVVVERQPWSADAPVVTVILPVRDRVRVAECGADYRNHTDAAVELIAVVGAPDRDAAVAAALPDAMGEWVHVADPDLVPHPGWDTAALAVADTGAPTPHVYAWGTARQVDGYSLPFTRRDQWGKRVKPVEAPGYGFTRVWWVQEVEEVAA